MRHQHKFYYWGSHGFVKRGLKRGPRLKREVCKLLLDLIGPYIYYVSLYREVGQALWFPLAKALIIFNLFVVMSAYQCEGISFSKPVNILSCTVLFQKRQKTSVPKPWKELLFCQAIPQPLMNFQMKSVCFNRWLSPQKVSKLPPPPPTHTHILVFLL